MTDAQEITRSETRGSSHLWFGLLTGPVAWSIQLGMNWYLAEVVACAPIAPEPGTVGGVSVGVLIAVVNALLLAISVGGGLVAHRCLCIHRSRGDTSTGGRAMWMARGGIINSVLFSVSIIVSYVPLGLLRACGS